MILSEAVKKQVLRQFERLKDPVEILVFSQEFECDYCRETRTLIEEIAGLSGKVSSKVYDFSKDSKEVEKYGVDKIPALVFLGKKDFGIRFFGIPGGYEFSTLLETLKLVSQGEPELGAGTKEYLAGLKTSLDIKVFVTPTCPYCPRAAVLAVNLALASDKVKTQIIEVSEFPHLAVKYSVQGVPKTVINETIVQEGAVPEAGILALLKKEVS